MKRRLLSLFFTLIIVSSPLFSGVHSAVFAADTKLSSLKKDIYEAAYGCKDVIDLTVSPYKEHDYQYTPNEMQDIIQQTIFEKVDLFNIDKTSYTYNSKTGFVTKIKLEYRYTKTKFDNIVAQYTIAGEELIKDIKDNTSLSSLQKALILHDRIAATCEYDYDNFINDEVPADALNMYGVLINHVAVCEGYAKTYMWLLNEMGIECRICPSDLLGHIWDIVKINGKEYHVDVTWDDPVYDKDGGITHEFFMLSSEKMAETHVWYDSFSGEYLVDYDMTPSDKTYENAFWQNSNTEFCYLDDSIYYIDNTNQKLCKWPLTQAWNSKHSTVLDITDNWYASEQSIWEENYSRLSSDGGKLFYSNSNTIYAVNTALGQKTAMYSPDLSGYDYFNIFGFKAENGYFYLNTFDTPNFESNTKATYSISYLYNTDAKEINSTNTTVSGITKTVKYTGKPIVQKITVKYKGTTTLKEGTDYTVAFYNNTRAGTATVKINGRGNYLGSIEEHFKISRISHDEVSLTGLKSVKYYTGDKIEQDLSVTWNGKELNYGTDYIISYKNNIEAGIAYVGAIFGNNFEGQIVESFRICYNLNNATVSGIKDKTYNGDSITQSYTIKYGSKTLKKGVDYTVKYSSNKSVGTAKMVFTGCGKYAGSLTKTFKINPKTTSISSISAGSKKLTVNIKKASGTGYQIKYSLKKNLSGAKTVTTSKTKYAIKKLKGKKKYYMAVRVYKTVSGKKYYSAWSSTKNKTTKK